MNSIKEPVWQKGFTLTELMVAMALAAFFIGGLVNGVVSSKTTFNSINAQSDVQQNGRAALFFIEKEILKAGYVNELNLATRFDTAKLQEVWPKRAYSATSVFDITGAFISGDESINAAKSGTDSIVIRYKVIDSAATSIKACGGADISALGNLAGSADDISEIVVAFYIANTDELHCEYHAYSDNNTHISTAKRVLVKGVGNIQVRYGIVDKTTLPPRISRYLTSDDIGGGGSEPEWSEVVAVSLSLLASSDLSLGTVTANTGSSITYELQDTSLSIPDDGRVRRVFSTTQGLRNRL